MSKIVVEPHPPTPNPLPQAPEPPDPHPPPPPPTSYAAAAGNFRKEYDTIYEDINYGKYATQNPSYYAVSNNAVMYLGLLPRTSPWDITNAIHETIGVTRQVRPVRQSPINRIVDKSVIAFEVRFLTDDKKTSVHAPSPA